VNSGRAVKELLAIFQKKIKSELFILMTLVGLQGTPNFKE
jgi:hypothetical protein